MADGILFITYLLPRARPRILREVITAARLLSRTLSAEHDSHGALPIEVLCNQAAMVAVQRLLPDRSTRPWQYERVVDLDARLTRPTFPLSDVRRAYLFKLSGLLQTRFNHTLYLDCDVLIVHPRFPRQLLARTLRVADVAMPLDPGRANHLVPGEDARAPATPTAAPWVAEPAVGPPMLCSAVLAFQRNRATDELFRGAAARLIAHRHPGVRQGDQEMIWFQWQSGDGAYAATLRVLAMPEEVYCPLERRQTPRAEWRATTWHTSWRRGVYPCAAVHGHAYLQREAARDAIKGL